MRVLVVGARNYTNYNEFMRNMTIAIEDVSSQEPEEKKIVFVHTGQVGAENMVTEYVGKIEKFMKQKGWSVKEEIYRKKFSGNNVDKLTADYDMMNSDIDHALVFIKDSCRRSEYCVRILKELNIPTVVIKER